MLDFQSSVERLGINTLTHLERVKLTKKGIMLKTKQNCEFSGVQN